MLDPTINVVLGADDNYARPLSATVHSLIATAYDPERIRIFVVSTMTDRTRNKLESSVTAFKAEFIDGCDVPIDHLPGPSTRVPHVTKAMWLRVFAGSILPPEVNRVIYLDSDTIVCRDIADLWNTEIDGKGVAAARSRLGTSPDEIGATFRSAGLGNATDPNRTAPYFNSGVLLCDLEYWRTHDVEQQTLAHLGDGSIHLDHPDQDALNLTFVNNWYALDAAWNNVRISQLGRSDAPQDEIEMELQRTAIAHLTSPAKPWHDSYPENPVKQLWRQFDQLGPWASEPLQAI